MKSSKALLFSTCLTLVLAIAIVYQPAVGETLVNLLSSLVAIVSGIFFGVLVFVFFLNYVANNLESFVNQQQSQDGVDNSQGSPMSEISESGDSSKTFKSNCVTYLIQKCKRLHYIIKLTLNKAVLRLINSSIMQDQMGNTSSALSYSNSSGVYETIRPHGQTPDEMLRSTYGPMDSSSAICISQSIDEKMHRIFEYTYRDYVETWYAQVSRDHGNFHKLLRADYWEVVKTFSERLSKLDTVNLIMNRFVTRTLRHMEELKLTAKLNASDEKPSFTLHPCLRNRNTELAYLRHICDYILILTLPPESARISSLRYILREVLASLAILPMVETLCEPDYINQTILAYFEWKDASQEDQSRAYAYAATYEDFIKVINECKSLPVLRQIRYRIMTEIIHATTISSLKKDQSKAGKARSMDKGELLINRDLKRYINQCQVAKQQCEKKIRLLGGEDFGVKYPPADGKGGFIESQLLSFEEIMNSPIARSYFLRYLKKIGKAPLLKYWNEMILLRFHCMIVKTHPTILHPKEVLKVKTEIIRTTQLSGKQLAKLVSRLYQTYVLPTSTEQLPLDVDKATIQGMQDCVVGNKSPTDFYTIQKQVFDVMKKDHYPSFVVSDVYTDQLMPEIIDQSVQNNFTSNDVDLSKAAFGGQPSTNDSLKTLKLIENKLEYKAQALESLKSSVKVDFKVIEQLTQEIRVLQDAKCKQQLYMERTTTWWDNMGKWNASIEKVHMAEEGGPVTPMYTIIVQCSGIPYHKATDDVSGWVIVRTLNEFHQLHHSLKDCSPWLKKYSLPKLPMFRLKGLSDKFLLETKDALDVYLVNILKDDTLRCSQIVYGFLNVGPDVASLSLLAGDSRSSHSTFAENLGEFFKRIPKDFMEFGAKQFPDDDDNEDLIDEDDMSANARDSVAEPLYRLISEIFELHGLFRFLRRSLIIFVRVAFGRSINRHVRETSQWLVSEPMMGFYLQTFLDSMWPDGKLAKNARKRTSDEKLQTKLELQVKLLQNVPEALNGLVGQENAKRGVLKVFYALQDKKANKHLFYNLLAEGMEELFPEILATSAG